MGWLAEILRKDHRTCSRCKIGPTHVYDPSEWKEGDSVGTPLCNGCLADRLHQDFSRFEGRGLLFEPALGPDSLVFRSLEEAALEGWPPDLIETARAHLDRIAARCDECGQPGRFAWIPAERDANLWSTDWLAGLADATLAWSQSLCGACAAARLSRSIEERGLYFEAIVPPEQADGFLCGAET